MIARALTVHPREECARRLGGISVRTLVAILRAGGYGYTELSPGAKPWGTGRQLWGMTDDQIAAVIDGQARRHAKPPGADDAAPPVPAPRKAAAPALPGHDGVSRLRLRRP